MNNSGWIILDKPTGMNSRRAGAIVARMFGAKTFGHMGTLDPMASGLLPIALGDATKMIPFWPADQVKEYLFSAQFGFETDTLDITGRVVSKSFVIPTEKQIVSACKKLTGEYNQIPPQYSAVHVGGQRAHKLARAGQVVEIPPRLVKIYRLELLGSDGISWQFRVMCSPGTYVRSIARDIAKICDALATVDMIHRTQTNGLDIKNAVKLDFLENMFNNGDGVKEYLIPMDFGLGDIPVLNLDDKDTDLYRHGGFINAVGTDGLVRVYNGEILIGIGRIDNNLLKPKRTIN